MEWHNKKAIHSITPFTLLDFPDKTACILWFSGCNMKCDYCYNPEIVFGKGQVSFSEIFSFLKLRKNLLDAVVLSGGECLIHQNILPLIQTIKEISEHINEIRQFVEEMTNERRDANKNDSEPDKANAYCYKVKPYFDKIRYHVDKLELLVDDQLWPLVKYRELLFIK